MRSAGWRVVWLGNPEGMEAKLVPQHGYEMVWVKFSALRGKGILRKLLLPFNLLRGFWQGLQAIRQVRPNVVLGMGGYITFPGGMMGVLRGRPLVLHEQNSVAGMANKVLSGIADRVFTAFPGVFGKAEWVGNPLRAEFLRQPSPAERFAGRSGPLRLLVVGGSLGAKALNDTVPQALALIPLAQRPQVIHQSGEKQIDALRANYEAAGVEAQLTPFIDDTAQAFAEADLIVCRAGASTVTEIAAVGAAALFVPFPHAVDDHQTTNARFLVEAGGAWLVPQPEFSPASLAQTLQGLDRQQLVAMATRAQQMQKTGAVAAVVSACEQLAKVTTA
jgi:UDP-N-acetylglucosamine--N-acetylmuramyl-(pentapeptide) pyrophosphoryl-undecaprenol N-acetylglucosamine transferase